MSVTLALAKQHLEYEAADRDVLIQQYIDAAVLWVEGYTGKKLIVGAVVQTENSFGHFITLNRSPFISLTSVAYFDGNSAPQTLTGARILKGRIYPPAAGWPAVGDYTGVTVTYQAGYTVQPADLVSAQLLLVGDMFAVREGGEWKSIDTVEALCLPYRAMIV